jgi:hypothetical protein
MKKRILPFLTLLLLTTMSFAQSRQIQVTVADSVQVVYIAGSINGWSEPGTLMDKVNDTTFTYDFEAADTAGIEYKFLTGPAWKYEQVQTTNFRYSTDSITRVDLFKAYYDTIYAAEVTIEVLVPVEVYELNLTGNFNGWNPTANPMEKVDSTGDGKVFTLTIASLDTTSLEYKFIAGPGWPYEQLSGDNYKYYEVGGVVVCDNFKKIFDPSEKGNITITITVPEGTPDLWIIGTFTSNWNADSALHCTQVNDTVWTVTVEDVADIEFKCFNYPDWPYEEAKDAEGASLDANRTASFIENPVYVGTVLFWKDVHEATPVNEADVVTHHIYVKNSSVVVEGVEKNVAVIDIQGRVLQNVRTQGTFMSRSLNTGVYIIRVDNKVQKVMVP